jgi:hypothetical protein
MRAELYLLTQGGYTFTLEDDRGHTIVPPTRFTVDGPRTRISFELPSRKPCVLKVVAPIRSFIPGDGVPRRRR